MNLTGIWKVKYIKHLIGDNLERFELEEALKKEGNEGMAHDYQGILRTRFVFKEDGTVGVGMVIPENTPKEEIQKAVDGGAEIVGDTIITKKVLWKEDDGKILSQISCDPESASAEGRLDEEAFGEVKVEDDMLVINALFSLYYLVKE